MQGRGKEWRGADRLGTARNGADRLGVAGQGLAWTGRAGKGMARVVLHSTRLAPLLLSIQPVLQLKPITKTKYAEFD